MIKSAKNALEREFPECHGPEDMHLDVAYTGNEEDAKEWKRELEEAFPGYDIYMAPLSLSVACHLGAGAKAIAMTKAMNQEN